MNLAYFELIGDTELINTEQEVYERITPADLREAANAIFTPENCSVLYYHRK
jgi:hypothetical protein